MDFIARLKVTAPALHRFTCINGKFVRINVMTADMDTTEGLAILSLSHPPEEKNAVRFFTFARLQAGMTGTVGE